MTLGQKIKKLRVEKALTQKDLADRVFVTFQTVSKWEKDENEPDVSTLRELAKLFGCSLDYLLSEDEAPKVEPEPKEEPVEQVTKTIIIHQKEHHVCARCKKDIEDDDDLEIDHFCVSLGGRGRQAVYRDDYYHKDCLRQTQLERAKAEEAKRKAAGQRSKKLSFGWGIAGGVVALITALLVFLLVPACKEVIHPGFAVLYSVIISYAIFADLYCIISGSFVGDVFLGVASWSIKMPGVIFSWDIDGIIWAISMKIFLSILGIVLGLMVTGLAIGLSAFLAVICFPFILVHNIHNDYADAL